MKTAMGYWAADGKLARATAWEFRKMEDLYGLHSYMTPNDSKTLQHRNP